MFLPEKKKWIGDRQVDSASLVSDSFDVSGDQVVEIKFIQGGSERFTQKMLQHITTDKMTDATNLRVLRCSPVAQAIFLIYAQFGVKVNEIDHVSQLVINTVNERLKQCHSFLWGVEGDGSQTMVDVARVLTERELKNVEQAKQSGK